MIDNKSPGDPLISIYYIAGWTAKSWLKNEAVTKHQNKIME